MDDAPDGTDKLGSLSHKTMSTTPDENGFVKRGFLLLGGMAILVAVVLSIIFYKPDQPAPTEHADLPPASSAGWQIRYNATVALLRRGSDKVPWPIVREMLDEKQQLKNSEFDHPNGRKVADEYQARSFVIPALQALAEWKRKTTVKIADVAAFPEISKQVDALATSPVAGLRTQAEETKLVLAK